MRELKPSAYCQDERLFPCRTPPGVRELKLIVVELLLLHSISRTPPGVRELKQHSRKSFLRLGRRTPPGVRELKQVPELPMALYTCRTPPGVRELKLTKPYYRYAPFGSHPSRGA